MFIKVKNKKATTSSTKSTNIRGTKIYDLLATNTQNIKQFHQKEWGKSYQIDIVNHSVLISIKNNSDMPQKNCPIGHHFAHLLRKPGCKSCLTDVEEYPKNKNRQEIPLKPANECNFLMTRM